MQESPYLIDTGSAKGIVRNIFGPPGKDDDVRMADSGGAAGVMATSTRRKVMRIGDLPSARVEYTASFNGVHTTFKCEMGDSFLWPHDLIIVKQGGFKVHVQHDQ